MPGQLNSYKSEAYTAIEAYCSSRKFPKPSHYSVATRLKEKIKGITEEDSLIEALYQTYMMLIAEKSDKLAPMLGKVLGHIYKLDDINRRVTAYHHLLTKQEPLSSVNFVEVFKLNFEDNTQNMRNLRHLRDECSRASNKIGENGEISLWLTKIYKNDEIPDSIGIIPRRIRIKDPIQVEYKRREGAEMSVRNTAPLHACR